MSDISVKIAASKPDLSAAEIAQKLEAERAAIPADVDGMVHEFTSVTNVTLAKKLLMVIDAFSNPQEGFDLWKAYYASGDVSTLKEAFLKQNFSSSLARTQIREFFNDQVRRGEKRPTVSWHVLKEIQVQFSRISLALLAPGGVNHIDTSTELALEVFMGVRNQVFNVNKDAAPLEEVLQPQLQQAFEDKLVVSLPRLRAAANEDLLPKEVVTAARDTTLEKRLSWFDRLANQSFGQQSVPDRGTLPLSPLQIPENQRFGIEFEGFFPSDKEFMKQSTQLWLDLRAEDYRKLGILVRFPLSSFLPKNDNAYQKWAITMDSSVVNPLRVVKRPNVSFGQNKINNAGLEIVSPVLEGQQGGIQALVVAKTLEARGFRSNQSCGFHVHVEVADASLEELKNVAKAFIKNERTIDGFIHPDRRGENAAFAKSVISVDSKDIDAARDIRELIDVVNKGDRNSKLDMTNLAVPGAPPTVQYRGEGGAGYLSNCVGYTVFMVNFTRMARKNPELTVDDVLDVLQDKKAKPVLPAPRTEVKSAADARP